MKMFKDIPVNFFVCASLIQEHRKIEMLLKTLQNALEATHNCYDLADIKVQLLTLELVLNTHFACEEYILFPAVTSHHPIQLMAAEHTDILNLRKNLHDLITMAEDNVNNLAELQSIGLKFIHTMQDHIKREDASIFPVCEVALSMPEKQAIIQGMETIRASSR